MLPALYPSLDSTLIASPALALMAVMLLLLVITLLALYECEAFVKMRLEAKRRRRDQRHSAHEHDFLQEYQQTSSKNQLMVKLISTMLLCLAAGIAMREGPQTTVLVLGQLLACAALWLFRHPIVQYLANGRQHPQHD